MAIQFSCPRCDKRYSVSDALVGKRIVCKACGQERTVPTAPPNRDSEPPPPSWLDEDAEAGVFADAKVVASAPPPRKAVTPTPPTAQDGGPPRAGVRRAAKPKRSKVPTLFDDRNMRNGIGGFVLVNLAVVLLARVAASGGHADPARGGALAAMVLLFSSAAMILTGLGGAVALLIRGGFSAMLRPLAFAAVGGLGILAVPYAATGRTPGLGVSAVATDRSRSAVDLVREYAGLLDEIAGLLGQIRDSQSALTLMPRFDDLNRRGEELMGRVQALGTLTPGEDRHVHETAGPAVLPALQRVRDALEVQSADPLSRSSMARFRIGIDNQIAQWSGQPREDAEAVAETEASPAEPDGGDGVEFAASGDSNLKLPSDPEAVALSLDELKAREDIATVARGADRLIKLRPDTRRDEIVAALLAVIDEAIPGFGPSNAAQALGIWATAADLPALYERLPRGDALVRMYLIDGIVRFHDRRTLDLLAAEVGSQGIYFQIRQALIKFGKEAEPAVIPHLKAANADARGEACQVLEQIGGKPSLAELKALTTDPDSLVAYKAKQAIEAIHRRLGSTPGS